MLPVIAIVGAANVGKSTLFNRLTRSRAALVADFPGLTRDRIYGEVRYEQKQFIVIDTAGMATADATIDELMLRQAKLAMAEADLILFLVDGRVGRTAADEVIANQIRQLNKPVVLAANKMDGVDPTLPIIEFSRLGFGTPFAISAEQGFQVNHLLDALSKRLPQTKTEQPIPKDAIKVAIIGRPNAGKSTLVNRILGEERVIVADEAGTTRDSIYIPFTRYDKNYVLIDTAGVRRRSRITGAIEKFSIVKTLQAIEDAQVIVYVIDARENVVDQDLRLLGFILEQGKALIIAVNKWDGLNEYQKRRVKQELDRKLRFINFVEIQFISALHGTGVGDLFPEILSAYTSAMRELPTPELTRLLQQAVERHQPPLVSGRRIKLRYAHQGGKNPPLILIYGNQTEKVPHAYRLYLENFFREKLRLKNTPLRLIFKTSENPFKSKGGHSKKSPLQRKKGLFNRRKKG